MYELYNANYVMTIIPGLAVVIVFGGNASGNPRFETGKRISTSVPVEFDEVNDVVTTKSGSKYKIMSYEGDREVVVAQIKIDIANGAYSGYQVL